MWSLHRTPVLAWSRLMLPDHADRPGAPQPLPVPAPCSGQGGGRAGAARWKRRGSGRLDHHHGPRPHHRCAAATAAAAAAAASPSCMLCLGLKVAPIHQSAADADLETIKESLHTIAAPEQFYGANFLRLRHDASGTVIRCVRGCDGAAWLACQVAGGHAHASRQAAVA